MSVLTIITIGMNNSQQQYHHLQQIILRTTTPVCIEELLSMVVFYDQSISTGCCSGKVMSVIFIINNNNNNNIARADSTQPLQKIIFIINNNNNIASADVNNLCRRPSSLSTTTKSTRCSWSCLLSTFFQWQLQGADSTQPLQKSIFIVNNNKKSSTINNVRMVSSSVYSFSLRQLHMGDVHNICRRTQTTFREVSHTDKENITCEQKWLKMSTKSLCIYWLTYIFHSQDIVISILYDFGSIFF